MVATTFEGDAVIDPRTVDRLTNLTDINRLLHEVTIKERGIVVELEKRLERRQELDNAVLHLASITAEELEMARADAEQLVSELNVHAERARQVSERVRALDTSQQNVQRALGNVNGILDRSNCIKAVQQALGTGDYEEAARFIASCSGQGGGSGGGPTEAAAGSAAVSLEAQQSQVLDEARQQLEREVRKKLGAAKDIQDHANVLRFVRLLPLLGREDEGVKELTAAVRRQVAALCMEWLQPMQKKLDQGDASFAEVLNGVLRVLGSTLGDHKAMVQQTFGGQAVLAVCLALQQECDNYGSRVLDVFMQKRQVAALLRNLQASGGSAGSRASGSASGETAPDPREVEAVLEEMRMLSFKGEEYLDWMLQQMRLSIAPQPLPAPAENGFRSGPFNVALQQLAGNYIVLEVFYMESSAAKAIQMDELGAERLTSSMVDDIFFVLRKSAMRSISLGSTQCACAVVGELNNFLANTLKGALHQKLQPLAARPKALLALADPEAAEPPLRANGAGQSVEGVRTLAAALNNADISGEYVQKLQSTLEEAVSRVMHQPGESERVRSVLSDLSKTSGELRALTDKAIDQVADALAAHLRAVVDKLSQSSYELTDVQYNAHEAEVTWERQLAATLQMLLLPLAELLTMRNQDALLLAALDRVLPRIEAALVSRTYNMLGGLALDREVRSLVNALGELTQQSVRDRLARLIQMATVLSLEEAEEMLELWGEASTAPLTWRLSAAEIRGLMLRRKDWPEADVRRLSLG